MNCVLFRNPSHQVPTDLKKFDVVPKKLSLDQIAIVSDAPVICGVGRAYGIPSVYCPDHYECLDLQLPAKKLLIFHFERTDYWSHHRNLEKKVEQIKKAAKILQQLVDRYHFQNIIVTGDHRTPVRSGVHETGTVPLLLLRKAEKTPNAQDVRFSDENCAGKPTVYGR